MTHPSIASDTPCPQEEQYIEMAGSVRHTAYLVVVLAVLSAVQGEISGENGRKETTYRIGVGACTMHEIISSGDANGVTNALRSL